MNATFFLSILKNKYTNKQKITAFMIETF